MRGIKLLPFLLIAGLLWFFFGSEQGSTWLAKRITSTQSAGPTVGRLMLAQGSFKRIYHGGVEELKGPLSSPLELHDGDRLETNRDAKFVLLLTSQDELEVGPLSVVSLHLWNAKDPGSAVYIQWLNGEVKALKTGVKGKAYLVKDGRLYFPGQKPIDKPLALTVLRNAPLDLQLADQSSEVDDFTPDDSPDEESESEPSTADSGAQAETLSNEYIDEMIVARQGQLQKCWLARLKDKPNLKGQMTLQFDITRRGKVKDIRVSDSALNDDVLKRCVTSVIERIQFRSFTGQEIAISYPITFE